MNTGRASLDRITGSSATTGIRIPHTAAIDIMYPVSSGILEYLDERGDPDSERLGSALRWANRLLRETAVDDDMLL